jgi:hypothetical protein
VFVVGVDIVDIVEILSWCCKPVSLSLERARGSNRKVALKDQGVADKRSMTKSKARWITM